jgi:hypothetical protein
VAGVVVSTLFTARGSVERHTGAWVESRWTADSDAELVVREALRAVLLPACQAGWGSRPQI